MSRHKGKLAKTSSQPQTVCVYMDGLSFIHDSLFYFI